MHRKLLTTIALVVAVTGTAAFPAAAAPASPGACNMFNVSSNGMDGMGKASEQGLGNMMELVTASFAAGCSP
jgi:hypothetical protein